MKRLLLAVLVLSSFRVVSACGSDTAPATQPVKNDTSFDLDGGFGAPVDSGLPECAEATKNVYVISEQNSLYSYNPPSNEMKLVGPLACPTGGATPSSMAVDRLGTAWVRHSDGSIWKVNTVTLACEGTAYQALTEPQAFAQFGMGFSTSESGGSNEQLFVSDSRGAGLAKLDLKSLKLGFVGPYTGDLANKTCELTGTGEGKLYGFFVTEPAQVAEISKGTGAIVDTKPLPNVHAGDAWAFSFYGGDFYIYTHAAGSDAGVPSAVPGSTITRYRPSDGSITVVKPDVGFKIVGAGVSTCAPVTGPR